MLPQLQLEDVPLESDNNPIILVEFPKLSSIWTTPGLIYMAYITHPPLFYKSKKEE